MSPPQQLLNDHPPEHQVMEAWLQSLRRRLGELNISAKQLAEWLDYPEPSSLRRKLRGATKFTAYEVIRLADVFDVPIASTTAKGPSLDLALPYGTAERFDGDRYMAGLVALMQELKGPDGLSPTAHFHIATTDMPLSPICPHPILAALKLFFLEGGGGRLDQEFDFEALRRDRPAYFRGAREVGAFYTKSNTTEIWGGKPLRSFLQQIIMLFERHALNREDAVNALDALEQVVRTARKAAKTGIKSGGGTFELYAHSLSAKTTDIVVTYPTGQLTVHTLRHPYIAVSRTPETAEIFLTLFEDLRIASRPMRNQAPFAYRGYMKSLRDDIRSVRKRLK